MKSVRNYDVLFAMVTFALLVVGVQTSEAQASNPVVTEFETRAKAYANERERIERTLPVLPKQATPEEVAAHKAAFMKAVQESRKNIKQGSIFSPEISAYFKSTLAAQLNVKERAELRKEVIEAENKAVTVRVNYMYPESQEILEMPATLLMALPQLPKQLKYRFVGRHMLLVDRENLLIVDYITNAVP